MSMLLVELGFKLLYCLGLVVNIVGLITGSSLLRQLALSTCPGILFLLLLSWKLRVGWVADNYAYGVLAGLALLLLGDLIIAEPAIDYLSFTGFACYLLALLCFSAAVSTPCTATPSYDDLSMRGSGSAHRSEAWPLRPRAPAHAQATAPGGGRGSGPGVAEGGTGPPGSDDPSMAVPIRPWRLLPALTCALVALGLWRAADGADVIQDSRFVAATCMFVAQALFLWRALARVGYKAPLVTVSGLLRARRRQRALMEIVEDEVLRRQQQQQQFLRESAPPELGSLLDPGGGPGGTPGAPGGSGSVPDLFSLDEALLEEAEEDYWSDSSGGDGGEGQRGGGAGNWARALSSKIGSALGSSTGPGGGSAPRGRGLSQGKRSTLRTLKQARRGRNRRQMLEDFSGVESRWWQWCAVAGAACISLGLVALGYDRLWLNEDPDTNGYASLEASALTYAYTLLAWVGQTLLVASVPCRLPRVSTLDDPRVSPAPTDGSPLRVVILLPAEGAYDVAEVAVPWYVLTRRGHSVAFATQDGTPGLLLRHRLPLPWEVSVHGYGCGAGWTDAEGGACCCCCPVGPSTDQFARLRPLAGGSPTVDGGPPVSPRTRGAGTGGAAACLRWLLGLLFCCWLPCCCCSSGGRRRGRGSALTRALCCGSDLCAFSAVGFGMGTPGPLVVAMYREMLEDASFRRPYAWSTKSIVASYGALPKRLRRRRRRRRRTGGGAASGGTGPGGQGSESLGSAAQAASASAAAAAAAAAGGLVSGASPRRAGAGGSGSDLGDGGSTSSGSDAESAIQEQLLVPDSFDGMIVVGAHPPAAARCAGVWDDPDLQGIASDFWATGRPVATFSSAAVLMAATRTRGGVPLCADSMLTGTPGSVETALAWTLALLRGSFGALCALLGCGCCGAGRRAPTVQARVTGALHIPSNFVPGPPAFSLSALLAAIVRSELPFLRPAGPLLSGVVEDGGARCVVVEDGRFLSAQCGSDAFLLARRFTSKLEEVQRVF